MSKPFEQLGLVKEALEKFEQTFLAHASATGPYSAVPLHEPAWCYPWHDFSDGNKDIYVDLGSDKGVLTVAFFDSRKKRQIRCCFRQLGKPDPEDEITWWLGEHKTYDWLEYKSMLFETWNYVTGDYLGSTESHDKAYWFVGDMSDVSYIDHYAKLVEQETLPLSTNNDYKQLAYDIIKIVRNGQPEWHPGRVRWTYIKELDEIIKNLDDIIKEQERLAEQPAKNAGMANANNKRETRPNDKSVGSEAKSNYTDEGQKLFEEIKDWSTFKWFSKEMVEGNPIELLYDIVGVISGFVYEIRLISEEYENLKKMKKLKDSKKINVLNKAISDIESWLEPISQSAVFVQEIEKIKEYVFNNEETKEAQSFLKEALSLLDLFTSNGHDFFLSFLPERENADTFPKKQKLIYAAEYFASYLKNMDISNKLELATSKLRTYCDTHITPETKTKTNQQSKPAETGQKIMPEKYIKLAEQIASNLEDWANPKDETGLRYEYVGHLKPISIVLEGFNEILNWLHLNRAEEGKYVQAAYDELISKAKVDDALLEKLYDGDEVFSEQCAIDLADALRLVAKTAGYVFVGKPIALLSEDEFIQGTDDEWITVGVAAKLLGVNPGVVSRWATEGEIKDNRKTGRNRRVLKSGVLLKKYKREHEDLLRDATEDLQDRANKIPDKH